MKLLLTGDIHIGRTSSRAGAIDSERRRTSAAWTRLVDMAIAERVRVVCLSGDIVDGNNRYWEALGPLEEGIRRLGHAGILTVAVAGNHDWDVFPRLARTFDTKVFRLLGEGGCWDREPIDDALIIAGWSFPGRTVREDPVASYPYERDGDLPVLGMVHGDLGVADSVYGPLSVDTLSRAPVDGWLLGHIHSPSLIGTAPWILYPGSLQAMDPGETGCHGPWLLEVNGNRLERPSQRLLSSVWYDGPTVDVSDWTDPERDLKRAFAARLAAIEEEAGARPDVLVFRPVLTGRTALHADIPAVLDALVSTEEGYPEQDVRVLVDRWTNRIHPALDVGAWEGTETVPGNLLALMDGQIPSELLKEVQRRMDTFLGADADAVSEEDRQRHLEEAAGVLLSEVLK